MVFAITEILQGILLIELVAVISALLFTILAAYENILCWFFGILSSAIYVVICMNVKLYQDALINVFYIVMGLYGFRTWYGSNKRAEMKISKFSKRYISLLIIIGAALTGLSGYIFSRYTDASFPFMDAFTTVFALIATWMQARKKIENWLFFIVIDMVSGVMYFYKELYLTSLLFIIYIFLATF
ncbi:MAG: nicotinamide riboside transporter PnuC, partial [Flavobacteriales bacterium]|nr:nicotinamide riboside transporter PnuC [Flavobacteriales bacterium]